MMPFIISVFAIFLLRQFFKTIPDDLIHAARLDGFSEFEIVWRIAVPAAMPAIIAFSIFSIVQHWNDLFWPADSSSPSTEMATPPLGIMFFRNEEVGDDYGAMMAATVMITAPLVVMFLLAQQKFIEGITFTGVRG